MPKPNRPPNGGQPSRKRVNTRPNPAHGQALHRHTGRLKAPDPHRRTPFRHNIVD
ncbi:hypothetical protein [Neisseria elongata]|uniref:hypothetical protein n=1 Tax=Neisseria elongata TaxID=495 RepID=UPI00136498E7|nr:hypothetical protein [Neisseria elongata]